MSLFRKKTSYTTVKVKKKDLPDGLWIKCPGTGEIIYKDDLTKNNEVCPTCSYHFMLPRKKRIELLSDKNTFEEWAGEIESIDTLGFTGKQSYIEKLDANQKKSGYSDAVTVGGCTLGGFPIGLGVMDFSFLGASMGSVVGEKITRAIELATKEKTAVIIISASGGARMQEGILSLMQMPRSIVAIQMLKEKKLPYIVLLSNPTTGGVTASFAMLGDIHLAEPGAVIGFAGRRVIEETVKEKLPDDFQKSEYLHEHGMIDRVVERKNQKKEITQILDFFAKE